MATAARLSELFDDDVPNFPTRRLAALQAAHAMGPMTFGRRVVAALLLVTMSSIGAAASIETQRQTQQTRIDLVDVPRGLPDIGSAACHDARSFCAKTVLRALHEDENLTGFLDNVRKLAKEAGTPGSADGYAVAVIDPPSLKLPEMLALGCRLSAGACADDVRNSLPPDADADAVIDAVISARTAAAQILALAATHPDVAKMPAAAMLGADAAACSPPGDAKRCDDSIIDAFRRAGRAGHDMGSLRAAEVLISGYAGGVSRARVRLGGFRRRRSRSRRPGGRRGRQSLAQEPARHEPRRRRGSEAQGAPARGGDAGQGRGARRRVQSRGCLREFGVESFGLRRVRRRAALPLEVRENVGVEVERVRWVRAAVQARAGVAQGREAEG